VTKWIIIFCLTCTSLFATTIYQTQIQVYEMLDADSTNRVFDTLTVRRMIDYSQAEVAADAQCLISTKRSALQSQTPGYYIDSNMVLNGVLDAYLEHYDAGVLSKLAGLAQVTLKDFDRSGTQNVKLFAVRGYNIYLYQTPSSSDSTDTLVVKYAENADPIAIGNRASVIQIPKDFELALIYKVCSLIYLSRQLGEMANLYETYYQTEINKRRGIYPADVTDSPVPDKPISP